MKKSNVEFIIYRSKLAKEIAEEIKTQNEQNLDINRNKSQCFLIDGEWGSGKSILTNTIIEEYEKIAGKKVVNIENRMFSFGNINESFEFLFEEINNKLLSKQVANISDLLKYVLNQVTPAENFTEMSINLGVFSYKQRLQGNNLNAQISYSEEIVEKFNDISNDCRIVIVLDDVDRLTSSEILYVTRLVERLIELPGFIILVPCKYKRIIKSVEKELGLEEYEGKHYLDKIISTTFKLDSAYEINKKHFIDNLQIKQSLKKSIYEILLAKNNLPLHYKNRTPEDIIWLVVMYVFEIKQIIDEVEKITKNYSGDEIKKRIETVLDFLNFPILYTIRQQSLTGNEFTFDDNIYTNGMARLNNNTEQIFIYTGLNFRHKEYYTNNSTSYLINTLENLIKPEFLFDKIGIGQNALAKILDRKASEVPATEVTTLIEGFILPTVCEVDNNSKLSSVFEQNIYLLQLRTIEKVAIKISKSLAKLQKIKEINMADLILCILGSTH